MECEWLEAGFYIISGGKSPERATCLLPERIVTVSTCIVESYPDSWALPWAATTSDELRQIQALLGLKDSEFAELRSWVLRAMDDEKFGWPDVFFSLNAAREFRHRFLTAVKDTRILGLSLARDVAEEFLRDEAPQEGHGGSGVWTMLRRGAQLNRPASPLGFDVLGAEYGGAFHTFSCNGLEQDFNKKLGITFNRYGLIDDYPTAITASKYTNQDDVGAEPVAWYPFRVDDYSTEGLANMPLKLSVGRGRPPAA